MSQIGHLSEKPWSDYTSADYSIEQWHAACLIHQHDGAPTSKEQCKLPVKTPSGAVNRNAVHSAAAALAGARGGVHASSDEKSSAANALIRYYRLMDEKPPSSLLGHSNVIDFLDHTGVPGMKWGVRNAPSQAKQEAKSGKKASSGKPGPAKTVYKKKPARLSDAELSSRIKRMELEKKYSDLNAPARSAGRSYARGLLENVGKTAVGTAAGATVGFFVQRALKARFPTP
jgi:hypothetical protein